MSAEQNKTLIRKIAELINSKDLDAMFMAFSPDFVDHTPGFRMGIDIQGTRRFFNMQFAAFPDMHAAIDDLIAEGDKVVARMTVHGTNTGPFMGMPPTGKPAIWSFIDIFRIVDGKLVEHWVEMDSVSLMQQLGIVPPLV